MNNRWKWASVALIVAGLAAGGAERVGAAATNEPGRVSSGDVKRETREAAHSARVYTEQQLEELKREADINYSRATARVARLRQDLREKSGEGRAELRKKVDESEKLKAELDEKLRELHQSGTSAWERVKSSFDERLRKLEEALR